MALVEGKTLVVRDWAATRRPPNPSIGLFLGI